MFPTQSIAAVPNLLTLLSCAVWFDSFPLLSYWQSRIPIFLTLSHDVWEETESQNASPLEAGCFTCSVPWIQGDGNKIIMNSRGYWKWSSLEYIILQKRTWHREKARLAGVLIWHEIVIFLKVSRSQEVTVPFSYMPGLALFSNPPSHLIRTPSLI